MAKTNTIGKLEGLPGYLWYHPTGISNILSMAEMEKYFPVTYGKKKVNYS